MKIIVGQHKLEIVKEPVNEREIDITKCEFEFDEAITSEYVKEAYFTLEGNTYKQIILNDECDIPSEVLVKKGTVEIGVVAFLVENEEEIKRYNPSPAYFNTWVGSLKDNAENSKPITPSDKEQIEAIVQGVRAEMDNLDIDAEKVDTITTVTITKKDGTPQVVEILDGEKGDKGEKGDTGDVSIEELNTEIANRISADENLRSQINGLASGSPLVASSTSEMTDTTRVYVNTTDGHWYYYDGTEWVDGGIYQSTGIADESISFDNLKSNLKNAIKIINVENLNPVLNKIINTSNIEFTLNGYDHTEEIELQAGETINVETLGSNQYVSVISTVSVDTTDTKSYTNRARMINDNSYHEYSYTANINETVIVSYKHNELKNLFISKNYNLDMINSKENYYFKNQYNLINSNDYFLKNSNVTTEIIDNNDVVYNKVLRVNLNYTSVVANYKYNLLKRFTIPNGTIIKNGYCYIDVKKISGDNVPCYLGIFNGTYGALRWKKITISNNEYERIYLPFYDVNNLTNNFPLYFGFYLNKNQLPEITSITSQLEIKEMGIVFNKKFYNTQENLFTPYDIMEMVQNKIEENTDNYKNALISIIGDSYSTYGGFIPDNYPAWYSDSGNTGTNNVNNVNQTWWYKLIKDLNASLLVNCSYSGSTICNTGYDGNYVPSSSFVGRMKTWMGEQRKTDTKPNVIFILGGLNDTWAGSPVGEVKYSNWSEDDLKSVLPAFCYMIDYLQKWNPGVKIINITSPDVSSAIRNGMNTACLHYDIKNIVVSSITKESGHPNQTGMSEIETAILSAL